MKIKYLIIVFLVLFLSISFVSAEDVEMNELTTTITVASCLKTDNSNPEVKGMLRFYPLYIQEYIDKNLQIPANSLVYKSDACISKNGETTTDLLEYSCFLDETNGKHKISADVIDCKSLGFNACENGACVIIEPEYSCLDTDFIEVNDLPETDDKVEHINFGVKGTTTKQNLNTGETWIVPEACSGNILFETYCNLENQDIEVTSYLCPEGTACSEGACIPQEPVVTTPSCSDTDFIENNRGILIWALNAAQLKEFK